MPSSIRFYLIVVLILMLCAACAQASTEETPNAAALANPASENCIQQGGQVEMRQNEAGEYGVCVGRRPCL